MLDQLRLFEYPPVMHPPQNKHKKPPVLIKTGAFDSYYSDLFSCCESCRNLIPINNIPKR